MNNMPRHAPDLIAELSPDERAELGGVDLLVSRLSQYVAPEPAAEATQALLESLRPLVAARAAEDRKGPAPFFSLAWSQTTLLEPAFWWSNGLLLLLGLAVVLLSPDGPLPVAFLLGAPVLAAAGVAYAFRSSVRSVWELEQACPIRPLELLYARLGLVTAFGLVTSATLLGVYWMREPQLVLWRLMLVWFGPMLCLAGVALYTTVRWGSIAGMAVPTGLWAALVSAGIETAGTRGEPLADVLAQQLLPFVSRSGEVLLAAASAALLGCLLLWRAGKIALGDAALWN